MRQLDCALVLPALILAHAGAWAAETFDQERELALVYGDKSTISIATGSKQPIRRAPSAATVITAQDIRAIGATDLDEVLETVPGLHVARSPLGYEPIFVFRGIYSVFNSQVLMLQNGIPTTLIFTNGKSAGWGGLPLENIARIEIIRGPGSALYGADAYAGVINIVTKTAPEAAGTEFGLRAGSFHTRDGWVLNGGTLGPLEVSAYLRVGSTDGFKKTIDIDRQSLIDPSVSLAPGPVNTGRDAVDASLDLSLAKWRLRLGYKQRDVQTGAGIASALDPNGGMRTQRTTADLSWSDPLFAGHWGLGFTASYLHYADLAQPTFMLFPPGANLGFGPFADGMLASPNKWERQIRLSATATYGGFSGHQWRFGVGHEDLDMYKTTTIQNFTGIVTPIGTGSTADLTDFSLSVPFMSPQRRKVDYLFAQDEWQLAPDWALTAGLRRDVFSDFGGATSPRLALVWEAAYDLTAKLMYGEAFRAPAFIELYPVNNPVALGNRGLKPETIKTAEAVLSWQPRHDAQVNVTLFRHKMKDIIRLVGTTFQNAGSQNGRGAELDAAWNVSRALRLTGSFAYQRSIDEATGADAGNAPRRHLYARADWHFSHGWLFSWQINHVADRRREAGDTRPHTPDYTLLDLTLRSSGSAKGWGFAVGVRNLFDANAREPHSSVPVQIPNDLPLAGRSVYLQASYRL